MEQVDIAILGAGAAGLFCAGSAVGQGRRVVVLDHARKPGEKFAFRAADDATLPILRRRRIAFFPTIRDSRPRPCHALARETLSRWWTGPG